jgi:hypothetical protein
MEDKVFPSPAVAELMKRFVVESRQHTDTQNTLTAEQFKDNRKAQADIAGTKANPFFVVVDPQTGDKIDTFRLTGNFTEWEGLWKSWLEGVLKKTGRM